MGREKFGSRLGFILVSAGCAIGLGNVWKFPYLCGQYGGAAFILIYLAFLVLLGIPILVCEFAVGRASRKSVVRCFETLQKPGTNWNWLKVFGIAGCYLLMMFYTMVAGWMMYYCVKSIRGNFVGATPQMVTGAYDAMLFDAPTMIFWTMLVCVIGFAVCVFGLQKGIERISKVMMAVLLVIMVVLAVNSVFLDGATEGLRFYLVPDFEKMVEQGIGNVVFAALSQAFFTLSLGIGSMLIFGSYMDSKRKMTGEALSITVLDTFVALTAGLIIIPASFAFGIEPGAGPRLIFVTLPNIFSQMSGGRFWSALFFLFLTFAAMTTVIAVFENIVCFNIDLFDWSRKKSVMVSAILIMLLSLPAVLGFNVLSRVQPLGAGSNIMDFEDFIVSNNLLPLGSLCYVLFCTGKNGWGWDNFINEVNTGEGISFPKKLKYYVKYVIPTVITVIYLKGYYDMFKPEEGEGYRTLVIWMSIAVALLLFVFFCALYRKKEKVEK